MKINTKFNINERIYIKELTIWGKTMSIFYDGEIQYQVRYFHNFEPKTVYFLENELSSTDQVEEKIGFKK